jgi:hypothetical protein
MTLNPVAYLMVSFSPKPSVFFPQYWGLNLGLGARQVLYHTPGPFCFYFSTGVWSICSGQPGPQYSYLCLQ